PRGRTTAERSTRRGYRVTATLCDGEESTRRAPARCGPTVTPRMKSCSVSEDRYTNLQKLAPGASDLARFLVMGRLDLIPRRPSITDGLTWAIPVAEVVG